GIALKADVIVNIDADGQYVGGEVGKLVEPIKRGDADVCLGSRFAGTIEYMPFQKRIGNIIATKVTCFLSGVPVTDAQTGFRAFSREAALRLNTLSDYTYTQENIIQAAQAGLVIREVPITFRKRKGESRLIHNIGTYALRSGSTILKTYRDYRPLRTFAFIGGLIFLSGFIPGARVLLHFLETGKVSPYMPSAILTAVLLILGFQVIVLGLIADMVGSNRKLLDELSYRIRKGE
ncbi:MAG: glycosyltransferase family 2 protein, partial [Candidatus Altiarchaeota archaeon]